MNFRAIRILAAALLASSCGLAIGQTKTTTFAVTATVVSNCFINSASAMAFGSYTPGTTVGSANVDQTSTILVRCSNTTPYGIGLNEGSATGSTFAPRLLKSTTATASTLEYNLYTDAARSTNVWLNPATAGAAGATNQAGTGTGLGNALTHIVYGRLLDSTTSQEAVPATDYTSTVTVTINY